nr:DNA ligase D [uncultured Bacillus sp.]
MNLKPIIPFEPVNSVTIPDSDEWIAQIKWDGVRVLTYYDGSNVQLYNRKMNQRTLHYPEITAISDYFIGKSVIFDGEVIALDEKGKPSFHEVMRRDGLRRIERVELVKEDVPIFYMIFDILYYNGKWICDQPLEKRLTFLQQCVAPTPHIQVVPSYMDTKNLWNIATQHQLEGIVCKKTDSPYLINEKNNNWQKIKNYQDAIAVIGGVTFRSGIVNSVLLGQYDQSGMLWYIGHCGTGKLTMKDWKRLTERVEPLLIQDQPFVNQPEQIKGVQWIRPVVTVKVNYIEWPKGKTLRQPSIQSFTETPAEDCRLPIQAKGTLQSEASQISINEKVEITHPEKPLWDTPPIHKSMYIEYLHAIYPYMAPFLKDRLLTVIRYPHGIFGEPFYQKNCPNYAPEFVRKKEAEGIQYILCNNEESLLWLGNQLAFEFHIPFQTIHQVGPGEIVFDLDPPSKDDFTLAIKAALIIKEVLDSLNLISFVKISGNKGLQIYLPLPDHRYTYEETRLFTSFMAEFLIAKDPVSFTIERMKKKRKNRLYVDYIQHDKGKTIIAPYSPRGNPKATVAAPLFWKEVQEGLTIDTFQLPNMINRIQTYGDPFASYFEAKKEQNFDHVLRFLKNR